MATSLSHTSPGEIGRTKKRNWYPAHRAGALRRRISAEVGKSGQVDALELYCFETGFPVAASIAAIAAKFDYYVADFHHLNSLAMGLS